MATFTVVKNKAQSGGSLGRVLKYVSQEKKTLWEERSLVSGWNCVAKSAYDEMMTTKQRFGKTGGRMFYQFVQSFDPAEKIIPQEVHAMGLELAQKLFPEFEVVVATHVDKDHLHNHLVVNSVSCEDGHKLHQNAADLQRQRQINDEICMAHGLTVLDKPQRYADDKKMRPGEYRSAVRGESWKFQLINTIDRCMRRTKSREEFIREMERRGYQVRWETNRKAITYTTPKGMKCRDDRLHEDKYKKEVMEREFRIREAILYRRVEEAESAARGDDILPHREAVDPHAAYPERPVPSAGIPGRDHGAYARYDGEDGHPGGEADKGVGGNAPVTRTGWEEEREAALSAEAGAAPTQSGLAVGDPDLGRVVGSLVRLGHRLEQSAEANDPVAPVIGHVDRKLLAKERKKKIAQGHKPDDHEEQRTDMTMG